MKRHTTSTPSIAVIFALALAFALAAFASPSRAANPLGTTADAGAIDDAAAAADADADAESEAPPEGIQPTTTPDNFGCTLHISRPRPRGPFDPVAGLGALGIGAIAVARRRRKAHRRLS